MTLTTKQKIIQASVVLLRSHGYAAFSYADIEKIVGIRKASIHHHFPSKEDLGREIIELNMLNTVNILEQIEQAHSSHIQRLNAFAEIFIQSKQDHLLPLCGALSAEMRVLPESLQLLTKQYFKLQLEWLEKTIQQGVTTQEINRHGSAKQMTFLFFSFLEGASFIHWVTEDEASITHMRDSINYLALCFQKTDTA